MWVPHDTRDEIVDYIKHWTGRTQLPAKRLLGWLSLGTSRITLGKVAMAKPTNTTEKSLATGGSKTGRNKRFSITTILIRSTVTAGSLS